jgi:hypothetical protein
VRPARIATLREATNQLERYERQLAAHSVVLCANYYQRSEINNAPALPVEEAEVFEGTKKPLRFSMPQQLSWQADEPALSD